MPHSAIRTSEIVLVDADRVGWAASGRNGGFVDASLTHGLANGKSRWPKEIEKLEAMGRDNLDGMQADIHAARARRRLAAHRDAVGRDRAASGGLAARRRHTTARAGSSSQREVRDEVASPTYLAGLFSPDTLAIVHPAKLAFELARACAEAGVADLRADERHVDGHLRSGRFAFEAGNGTVTTGRAVLATNVFPSLIVAQPAADRSGV